jgi:DNA invertase Pin-like site-specific DNA recombinase
MSAAVVQRNACGRRIGNSHPNAKLKDADISRIFELRDAGLSYRAVAEQLGCSKPCVWKILNGYRRCQTPVSSAESLPVEDDGLVVAPAAALELHRALNLWR